jgi:hypothetical protein
MKTVSILFLIKKIIIVLLISYRHLQMNLIAVLALVCICRAAADGLNMKRDDRNEGSESQLQRS